MSRIAIALFATVTLAAAAHANEFDMSRERAGQMFRAQDVVFAADRITAAVTPGVQAKDPKLRLDAARLRDRAAAIWSGIIDQRGKLLATQVGGDPNVINDRVNAWAHRKSAMVVQTLVMTGWRNESKIAACEAERKALEARLATAGGTNAKVPADPVFAQQGRVPGGASPVALLGQRSE